MQRARARVSIQGMRSYSMSLSLSLYTQTPRTPITHAINHAGRLVESRLVDVPSRLLARGTRGPAHADARLSTMHGLTMTSAVVGTKMTTRATSASSRVSRGALTIVNSGAGPKRVRSNAGTGATARECVGMNEMRARGRSRGGGFDARRSRSRDDAREG